MTAHKLFALLVGIDQYVSDHIPDLSGCVTDALSVRQYLVDCHQVPPDHIRMLADGDATRQAIIQALQDHFVNNDRIDRGDAMLFYFAGHGSQCDAPAGWTTDDGNVETISPHDESNNPDSNVCGIPDRTLFALLHQTAEARGNNITTILDCCHSGSGTRGVTEWKARGHQNPVPIHADLDQEILGKFTDRKINATSPVGFFGSSMSSHVLLAACRQDEIAREVEIDGGSSGIFTHELLKVLRQISTQQTTYAGLLNLLPPLQNQHPQCEGHNKHCLLFTSTPHHSGRFFEVKQSSAGVLEVNAGITHGVAEGTEFVLYEDTNQDSPLSGIFYATSVSTTSSKLAPKHSQPIPNVPRMLYALVSRWENPDAKLAVFIDAHPSSMRLFGLVSPVWKKMATSFSVIRASLPSGADIILHDTNGESELVKIKSLISSRIGPCLHTEISIARDRIHHVLQSAAHFKFHLLRTNKSNPLHGLVNIELYRLKEVDHGQYAPAGGNFVHDRQARIILNNDLYGATLRNDSDHDLFPSLFYFDPSDFSIQPWYVPPSSTMAAPLRQKSFITVGHGNNDGRAIRFSLKPDDASYTAFLVLFLSTQYADMENIQQSSVFDRASDRGFEFVEVKKSALWDTAHATITVARKSEDFEFMSRAVHTILGGFSSPSFSPHSSLSLQERFFRLWL